MCGICGKVNFNVSSSVRKECLSKMLASIFHRGPDGSGIYVSGCVGLGHRRLAIIDLDTGGQPMSNEDGQVWITYNGEIYNYRELRSSLMKSGHNFRTKSDTEVIVHLYEELGEECLAKLNGMFAFAIWDAKRSRLFLARDRIGIKPLYYSITKAGLLFASEIKALLQDDSVEARVNLRGIQKYLRCTYTPGPETVFENILKLQPGHYLVLEDGKIFVKEYWDLRANYIYKSWDQKDLEHNLVSLLKDAVDSHMIGDVPVGFLLSGGVDSTATLCFYREQSESEIKTFTIGFESKEFEDERKYARIAAKRYGVDHYETTIESKDFFEFLPKYIWLMEEPVFEAPGVSLYFVTKMASEHVKVLISGEGGDEAFAGYQTYRNLIWLERAKTLLGPAKKAIGHLIIKAGDALKFDLFKRYGPLVNVPLQSYYRSRASTPIGLFNSQLNKLSTPEFEEVFSEKSAFRSFTEYFEKIKNGSVLAKLLYIDTKTWLPDRLLLKADKMTMANSLELRVPLLDHRVLEFASDLPDNQKLNGFRTKYIFKRILRNRIPIEIINRKKAGFSTPYEYWLNTNRNSVLEILMDKKTRERGYFENIAMENLLFHEWLGKGRYSNEVFELLILELWHRVFIDGDYDFICE